MNIQKLAKLLERELTETQGFFEVDVDIDDNHVLCVNGYITRDYDKTGDGINEPIINELTYQNLEIGGAFIQTEDNEFLLTNEQINEIEELFKI